MSWKTEALECTSSPLHLCNRGVNGGALFLGSYDYHFWMELMARYLPRFRIELLMYSLMPNHYHICLLQHIAYEASHFIQQVSWRYAKHFNKRYRRFGHLFAGRFGPQIVTDDEGLLRLSHYIHMNPVAAKLCDHPEVWPYSSCAMYTDAGNGILVNTEPILKLVGGIDGYKRFLAEYNPDDPFSIHRFMVNGGMTK
jgi:putative transposase